MDLNTVTHLRSARTRHDLVLAPGESYLAGGSWLFSEPQDHLTGLVDLTTLGWAPWTETDEGLSIAATCTVAELVTRAAGAGWSAAPLFARCAEALLMSFKVWSTATVGGNLCLGLPAGSMIALGAALGAEVVLWAADGSERRVPVVDFVIGPGITGLASGEVLRSVEIDRSALESRVALGRMALTSWGRSSSLVIGRLATDGSTVLTVSAATPRPRVLVFATPPGPDEVAAAVAGLGPWYDDAHGAADWRAAVTRELAVEVCAELAP